MGSQIMKQGVFKVYKYPVSSPPLFPAVSSTSSSPQLKAFYRFHKMCYPVQLTSDWPFNLYQCQFKVKLIKQQLIGKICALYSGPSKLCNELKVLTNSNSLCKKGTRTPQWRGSINEITSQIYNV